MRRLLAALTLTAALPALPAAAGEVTDFTLPNGLQVVVIEDHRAPVAVQMLWYRVGAADEPAGKSGIAHFLEHLMFKGTDEIGPGEFSAIITAQGGSDNAFTGQDYTAYFQRVAADRLDLMMKIEADRMRDLEMTVEDVTTERQVILEERNQRTDNDPGALLAEQRSAAQYLNHPYGIPIIGWRHEIAALDREDAFAFYRRFYAPNNAVLVVAGDVTPAEVREMAERHYGPIAPTPDLPERLRPQEPPQLAERRLSFSDPRVAQPYLLRTYLAPERDPGAQEAAARLELLAAVLGGNPATSVLARKLQFGAEAPAIQAAAFYDGSSYDDTTFGFYMVPRPGLDLAAAEAALDAALTQFLEEGIDPAQFERIKMQLRAARIYAEDSVQGQAQKYGSALTSGLTLADVEAWPDIIEAVTAEEVMTAARALLDRRRAVTALVTPAAPEPAGMAETGAMTAPDPVPETAPAPAPGTAPEPAPGTEPEPEPGPGPDPVPGPAGPTDPAPEVLK